MSLHEYDDLDSIGCLEDRCLDRSPGQTATSGAGLLREQNRNGCRRRIQGLRCVEFERGDAELPADEPRSVAGPTKSRRRRTVAIDGRSLEILRAQVDDVAQRAHKWGEPLVDDPYVFTDSLDGS